MSSFMDRLKTEEKELSEKIEGLGNFLSSQQKYDISEVHRNLLFRQHSLMVQYSEILKTRLHILTLEGN